MNQSTEVAITKLDLPDVVSCQVGDRLLLVAVEHGVASLERMVALDPAGAASWQQLLADPAAAAAVQPFATALAGVGLLAGPPAGRLPPSPPSAALELDADAFANMARAILAAGHRLHFRALGHSMRPQIQSRTVLEVEARPFDHVRRGAIALYGTTAHRLVAHRVLRRTPQTLVTRGDSAARIDTVTASDYLGVVVARFDRTQRIPLDTPTRRLSGLAANGLQRIGRGAARWLIVKPMRQSALRAAARWFMDLGSAWLLRSERWLGRWRRRLDVGRAVLRTSAEKDAERARLYSGKAVRDFTALDENVVAGLTLIEQLLCARHSLPPGASVLVLGCGPGRECLALASRGYRVTGADRDPAMLALARAHADRQGLTIDFAHGDATTLALPGTFDAVVAFSGLYNMVLPRARRVDLLRTARRHLKPDGKVLLTFLSDYVPPQQPAEPTVRGLAAAINKDHEDGDLVLWNEAIHLFRHPARLVAEARDAGLAVAELFRDQRAYDRGPRQVRGYAVLVVPT